MKILHIIESTATGTLSMLALLANSQVAQGHSVSVVYSKREETPSNIFVFFEPKINLIFVDMLGAKHAFFSVFSISSVLKSVRPDVVFLHSSFAGFLGRISALVSRLNAPIYYVPHCISLMRKDLGFFGHLACFFLEFVATIKKSTYIACSQSELAVVKRHFPYVNCTVIENAVDLADFPSKKDCEINRDDFCVVTVGQIRLQKNPDLFIEIVNLIRKKFPNVRFVWVGDGDSEFKSKLAASGVYVTGWKSRQEVIQFLLSSDIYISTSLWEGMPVSLIEASAACLPIVANNCAGNIDVVTNDVSGFIFDNAKTAAVRVSEIVSNKILREKIVTTAFNSVHSRFSRERYISDFNSLLIGDL